VSGKTNIDTTILTGWFKDRFGSDGSILPMTEDYTKLSKHIGFNEDLLLGEKITQPIRTASSSGFTFAGATIATGTMFALKAPNSPTHVEASWTSMEFVLRERTSWKSMRAASSSEQSFGKIYDEVVKNMRDIAQYVRDLCLLHGSSTLGKIESYTGTSTTRVWTLTLADTNAGIWYPLNNALLDTVEAYGGTVVNTTQTEGGSDMLRIVSVDTDASGKVLLAVSGNATDLTAIDADITAGTSYIILHGSNGSMMVGLNGVVDATSYAGVSVTDYPQWGTSSLNAQAAGATFSKIMHALRKNKLKSGSGRRTALLSDATMLDIVDNLSALQRGDKNGGKFTLGADEVLYEAPGLNVSFECNPLQREGQVLLLDYSVMERIGSTDLTFDPTGMEKYFEAVSGYAGQEMICYWDQALKVDKPNTITVLTNVVNTY